MKKNEDTMDMLLRHLDWVTRALTGIVGKIRILRVKEKQRRAHLTIVKDDDND